MVINIAWVEYIVIRPIVTDRIGKKFADFQFTIPNVRYHLFSLAPLASAKYPDTAYTYGTILDFLNIEFK